MGEQIMTPEANPELNGFAPIKNKERKGQVIDFRNLMFRGCWPTDIDACLDFRKEGLIVFLEYKKENPIMSGGQCWTFEHLVQSIGNDNKLAVIATCAHHVEDAKEDVDGGNCIVANYYDSITRDWIHDGKRTAHDFIEDYLELAKQKKES